MTVLGPDPLLAATVARAELQVELQARAADVQAGLVPPWVRRSLFPHELQSRVSFLAIADAAESAAANLARRLTEDRQHMTMLIGDYLADAPNAAVVAVRLADLQTRGILTVPGAGVVIDQAERAYRTDLERLALEGASRAVGEAVAQGVPLDVPVGLDLAASAHLDAVARRLAVVPHVELVQALSLEAARLGPAPVGDILGSLETAGVALSPGPLELSARNAVSSADGLGRQAAAYSSPAAEQPARVYASEILDGRECIPCSQIDGREYPSVEAARADYPAGIYRSCVGLDRCRGTLVFVWQEAAPTVDTPAG